MSTREEAADLVVVGAGAAGLWAAARAGELGLGHVVLLEKTPRTGTKVLASGGTHCNLTTTLPPDAAARTFGPSGERFLRTAFRELPPLAVRERFARLGVPTVEAPLDKVFPASGRARDVRDALERAAREAGARLELEFAVASFERDGDAWCVRAADGRAVRARALLLCPGGASYARTGTTGDGYAWLSRLDLRLVPPVPALAPLASPAAWVHSLSGISMQEAEVRLVDASGRKLAERRRPILFTHQGVSGPGAMDVSEAVARRQEAEADGDARCELVIDLLPEVEREELRERLIEFAGRRGEVRIARALNGRVPRRLLACVCEVAGLADENPDCSRLTKATRHALVETIKGLRVPISGTLGFDQAEVTAGGLHLGEVDPGTMRVRRVDGLWVCGELLDLTGPIGGLNFQAAFACAELAARSLASRPR